MNRPTLDLVPHILGYLEATSPFHSTARTGACVLEDVVAPWEGLRKLLRRGSRSRESSARAVCLQTERPDTCSETTWTATLPRVPEPPGPRSTQSGGAALGCSQLHSDWPAHWQRRGQIFKSLPTGTRKSPRLQGPRPHREGVRGRPDVAPPPATSVLPALLQWTPTCTHTRPTAQGPQ